MLPTPVEKAIPGRKDLQNFINDRYAPLFLPPLPGSFVRVTDLLFPSSHLVTARLGLLLVLDCELCKEKSERSVKNAPNARERNAQQNVSSYRTKTRRCAAATRQSDVKESFLKECRQCLCVLNSFRKLSFTSDWRVAAAHRLVLVR
jgi:hypothetical protein